MGDQMTLLRGKGVGSALGVLILSVVFNLHSALASTSKFYPAPEAVPGEFVIKLKEDALTSRFSAFKVDTAIVQTLGNVLGDSAVEKVVPFKTDASLRLVKLSDASRTGFAMQSLAAHPAVKYIEPNYIYRKMTDGAPNDEKFGQLWGLKNSGQADPKGQVGVAGVDINILPIWNRGMTGSQKVLVAVIDTGVDYTHPDLVGNIFENVGEGAGKDTNGIDDDGNGFIDDRYGWDFANNKANGFDDNAHGTHCAGTIGGMGNNQSGVAGVNWQVSILPVKFLSASGGGTLNGAVEAIKYATKMGAQVMSNSWGGGGYSKILEEAILETEKKGVVFVAAAGNEYNDNDARPTYPANYKSANIISVAAVDNTGKKAGFSNWGATTVHVAAPGVNILSTVPGGKYESFSGTSMATPHVSGIVALMLASQNGLTYAEVKERLIKTSTPMTSLKKMSVSNGMVNVANAIDNIVPPQPEEPTDWKKVSKVIETPHPYEVKKVYTFKVTKPGSKAMRVIFDKIDVEQGYDIITIETPTGEIVDQITGTRGNYTSEYVKGDTLIIRMKSDEDTTSWGFKVSGYEYSK